ncbi:hypothetical protein [Natronobeatus ordinarius]|uniref:hypothetical protein n=1 Tax=Natronobeatus ordinarius TaxID=2963433 RepID=UPI0020CC5E0B|nr:hypothetical protein [Natronobeatus ordinarius]
MASGTIDKIDMIALWVYPTAASIVFGIWTLNVQVLGGYDLSRAIFTAGSVAISVPLILATTSMLWILWTNEFDGTNYSQAERWTMVGTLALPIIYEFVPVFASALQTSDWLLIGATGLTTFSTVWLSYTE